MKKIYFNLITLLALSFAILSCGEETEIPNDIVEENEIAEEEIVKNDIIFEPFEVVGRSIDVEFDGKHLWVAHYEDSKISKLDVDGNVLKVVDVEGEPIKITYGKPNSCRYSKYITYCKSTIGSCHRNIYI